MIPVSKVEHDDWSRVYMYVSFHNGNCASVNIYKCKIQRGHYKIWRKLVQMREDRDVKHVRRSQTENKELRPLWGPSVLVVGKSTHGWPPLLLDKNVRLAQLIQEGNNKHVYEMTCLSGVASFITTDEQLQ